ncbi:MAG: hypothetical protein AAF573_06100 [Bacteroidota bacterium]
MKRRTILLLVFVFCVGMLSSCTKKCKGGGWYGDRNLGYIPAKKKLDKTNELATVHTKQVDVAKSDS